MFAMFVVSNIDLDRLSVEIHYRGQILCEVYAGEGEGGHIINFSCEKYVGVADVEMSFPVDEFKKIVDEAVAALR
jgi:hypothetical protein